MDLSDKTALLTGAAGAIGVAAAQSLAAAGAHVVMVDCDERKLEAAVKPLGDAASSVSLDLRDADAIRSAITGILEERTVDILVNNAGVLSNSKLFETTLDAWQEVHQVNLDAAFLMMKALAGGMIDQGWGRIINISSFAAKCGGLTAGTSYATSKSGLIGLTFSAARELAGKGITVNAIAPAYVLSPMVSEKLSDDERRRVLSNIPVGRFCAPEEVAHTICFLASPLAGFITGEVLDMNGGLQFD